MYLQYKLRLAEGLLTNRSMLTLEVSTSWNSMRKTLYFWYEILVWGGLWNYVIVPYIFQVPGGGLEP